MPLQIDRLIATSVDAQTITSNGAPVGGSPLFIANINTGSTYTTISSTETIVGTLFVPANSIKGVAYPYITVDLKAISAYSDNIIIKIYVGDTPSIDGLIPIRQETIDKQSISIGTSFIEGYGASGFPGSLKYVEYVKDKMIIQSYDPNSETDQVGVFDNFDVSKNLYVTITAEKIGNPIDILFLSTVLSITSGK